MRCIWGLLLAVAAWSEPRFGGQLTIAQRAEPRTLNPVTALDVPSRELIRLMHADLVHINRETLKTEPGLAESWAVSPDRKSITVRLRTGLRFSDGTPLTEADVLFSFQVYLDEAVASPQRDLLLAGGRPVQVRQAGPRTVRFAFAEPYAPAERLLDSVYILPKHQLEDAYRQGKLTGAWTLATPGKEIAGAGPFRLANYQPGQRALLERNPHYWKPGPGGKRLPYLDQVQIRFVPDADAEAVQLRNGGLDLMTRVPAKTFTSLRDTLPGHQFYDAGPSLEYHFLFFNLNEAGVPDAVAKKQGWFRQAAFRRAVSAAVDRAGIRKLVYQDRSAAIWQPTSPGNRLWFHSKLRTPDGTLEGAKKLLREAGFRWNAQGQLVDAQGEAVTFTVAVNAGNSQHGQIATILQQDLARLGIRVQTVPLEFRSLVDRVMRTRDYDAAVMALAPGDADPGPEMTVWLTSGRSHFWNLKPARPEAWEQEIDSLMRRQMTAGPEERRRMYDRVQEIAQREMPLICLASPNILTISKAGLRNVRKGLVPPYALDNAAELYWEGAR